MRIFDVPYPQDYVFIKVAGTSRPVFLPLCEAFAVVSGAVYDQRNSTSEQVVLTEKENKTNNPKLFKISSQDFTLKLQHDLYGDKQKITTFVIQPEGEMQTAEVTEFLEKY